MALPSRLQKSLTASEINFIAENEPIKILPRYTMEGFQLIGTRLPPLKAMKREEIPLWLALILKSQDRCNIITPDWLTVKNLHKAYEEEVEFPTKFSNLPWHWIEISKMLLDKASDDLVDPPHQLRSLIQDLLEVRLTKTRQGIKELNVSYIQLDNLSMTEISTLKPFCIQVMDQLVALHEAGTDGDEGQAQV
ncbi:hypothetical protein PACTADRAFT_24940, partial [Pachysolen tannophilus NRRL Y-2460]